MYRLLDECDGKQARRTGNSSPLGLFFDHGVDSLSVGTQAIIMFKCIQVGTSNECAFFIYMVLHGIFHFTTMEEYYTGGLFLGPFNGVSDGSILLYTFYYFLITKGNEVFLTTPFPEYT